MKSYLESKGKLLYKKWLRTVERFLSDNKKKELKIRKVCYMRAQVTQGAIGHKGTNEGAHGPYNFSPLPPLESRPMAPERLTQLRRHRQ